MSWIFEHDAVVIESYENSWVEKALNNSLIPPPNPEQKSKLMALGVQFHEHFPLNSKELIKVSFPMEWTYEINDRNDHNYLKICGSNGKKIALVYIKMGGLDERTFINVLI
jgi:hypothetical protein